MLLDLEEEEVGQEGILGRTRLLMQSYVKVWKHASWLSVPRKSKKWSEGRFLYLGWWSWVTRHSGWALLSKCMSWQEWPLSKEILEPFLWLSISPRSLTGRRKRVKPGDKNLSPGRDFTSSDNLWVRLSVDAGTTQWWQAGATLWPGLFSDAHFLPSV